MQQILLELIHNFWDLLSSIAIYILLGVLLAGVFKEFLPDAFIKKHLGGHGFMANIKAAVIGIPLPLCSCSVIPFVAALKKSGASKSAIQTFLISTPITGADSILATYGVMGGVFTLYRTISSVVISLIAGFLSILFVKEDEPHSEEIKTAVEESSCCSSESEAEVKTSCCSSSSCADADIKKSPMLIIKEIILYAFDDIYKDIAKSMIIGIVLGALIMTFMPTNLTDYLSNNLPLNYVLVLLIAMPLYVCATSSVPLGIALFMGGFSPGAVFIFLTAGPATNAITMSVVHKSLGRKSLLIYLSSILFGSLLFAFILDVFFAHVVEDIMDITHQEDMKGWLEQIAGVIMLLLSIKYILQSYGLFSSAPSCCSISDCGTDKARE